MMFRYKLLDEILKMVFIAAGLAIAAGAICEFVLKPIWQALKNSYLPAGQAGFGC